MLNEKTGLRELAYVVKIDDLKPIEGSDNCECAVVGGWNVMTRKGTFQPGDLAIYFEIDSKVDTNKPEFSFLASKHGKIKTQKYTFGGKGNFVSQGLLMSMKDFPNFICEAGLGNYKYVKKPGLVCVGDFLTKELGVTYADAADNKRKADSADKYKLMAQRNGKLFSKQPFRWLMRRTWGKKLLFIFFGKKKDKKNGWPAWVVKTDEERRQNMPWLFPGTDEEYFANKESIIELIKKLTA